MLSFIYYVLCHCDLAILLSLLQNLSVAALFLAAKVEEQPRKLEHVIKIAHACLHKEAPPLDVRSEVCIKFYIL